FERQRRREGLMVVRTVEYFGFVLEREVEPLRSPFPPDLAAAARAALVQALLAGETPHPDQGRIRKELEPFGFYWRPFGGRRAGSNPATCTPSIVRCGLRCCAASVRRCVPTRWRTCGASSAVCRARSGCAWCAAGGGGGARVTSGESVTSARWGGPLYDGDAA